MARAKNFFSDFDIQESIDEKGRKKKVLIYKGNTWTMQVPEEKLPRRKIIFLMLTLVMVGLSVFANLQNVAGNRSGIAAGAGLIFFVAAFFMGYSCIYSLILKTPVLQRAQYRETSIYLKIGSAAAAVLALTAMVTHIVIAAIGEIPGERGGEILAAALWLAAGGIAAVLFFWEMKTEYVQKRNDGTVVRKEHFRRGSETY